MWVQWVLGRIMPSAHDDDEQEALVNAQTPLKGMPTGQRGNAQESRISGGLPTAPRAAADRYWTTT